jgi:hypothetical protein
MNSKLVTIGVVAAVAAMMVAVGVVGTNSAFARLNIPIQAPHQSCHGENVGCNQNNAQQASHFGQHGNVNVFDNDFD